MHFQVLFILTAVLCTSLAKAHCYGGYPEKIVRVIRDPLYPGYNSKVVEEIVSDADGDVIDDKIIDVPGRYPRYGAGYPYLDVDVEKIYAPRKGINVEVDVQKEAGYPVVRRRAYRPAAVAVSEKVKAPSVAVKERETLYEGGEQERARQIVSGRRSYVVKDFDLGC